MVKNLPVMQETQVRSLSQEYFLESGMAIQHTPVFLPGELSWTEEPAGLQPICKELDITEMT